MLSLTSILMVMITLFKVAEFTFILKFFQIVGAKSYVASQGNPISQILGIIYL